MTDTLCKHSDACYSVFGGWYCHDCKKYINILDLIFDVQKLDKTNNPEYPLDLLKTNETFDDAI